MSSGQDNQEPRPNLFLKFFLPLLGIGLGVSLLLALITQFYWPIVQWLN